MKLLLALLLIVAFPACTALKEKAGCAIQDKLVTGFAGTAAEKLECKNYDNVRKFFLSGISKFGMCSSMQTGPFAETFCPMVVASIVPNSVDFVIPKDWECSAVNVKATLSAALLALCKQIPVAQPVNFK